MFLILALLLAPLFQAKFDIVKLKPLKGAITEPVKIALISTIGFQELIRNKERNILMKLLVLEAHF